MLHFPASLKELKEDWCSDIQNLNKIIISPKNGQFMMKEEKYLIGKNDPNKDEFDKLLFGCHDIDEISIPPNIKIISPSAFHNCSNLIKVEIPSNSNLQSTTFSMDIR